jgi:hypothetical protein
MVTKLKAPLATIIMRASGEKFPSTNGFVASENVIPSAIIQIIHTIQLTTS